MNFAVIPTTGRACLQQAVDAISPQVDWVFVLFNNTPEELPEFKFPGNVRSIHIIGDEPLNLSRIWNRGIDYAHAHAKGESVPEWNVAVINDDALPQPDWFSRVSGEMRAYGAAAASTRIGGFGAIKHTQPGPVNLFTRLCGWAFIVAGEKGMRINENLHFWYGDDDADWQSRQLGGTLTIGGSEVPNLYPNGQVTPELQARIAQDRIEFGKIWGMHPW